MIFHQVIIHLNIFFFLLLDNKHFVYRFDILVILIVLWSFIQGIKIASGLIHAKHTLKNIKDISFITLDEKDVIRHKLVIDIIKAYKNENND